MKPLDGKRIVLGITGGIGAYKTAELIRLLVKAGAEVHPVMTRAACEFITPLTLSTLAGNPTLTSLFDETDASIPHIELADKADLILIAPATANIIGKIASGIADDILTTLVLAAGGPLLIAPAMNHRMWDNPAVKENVKKLEEFGYHFVGPAQGELACGYEGRGRLSPLTEIVEKSILLLTSKNLAGERVLITAGPTHESIDPIRFLTNSSSGKMGYALARAAVREGALVTLVSGPTSLEPPAQVRFVSVVTAEEMHEAAMREFEEATIVIMAAAVSDFSPKESSTKKLKKDALPENISIEPTRDILKEMGEKKKGRLLIGFALETDNLIENATEKLLAKDLDLIVANPTGSMQGETTSGFIIAPNGTQKEIEPSSKAEAAKLIIESVVTLKKSEKGLKKTKKTPLC